jgi:hypothetical protein
MALSGKGILEKNKKLPGFFQAILKKLKDI